MVGKNEVEARPATNTRNHAGPTFSVTVIARTIRVVSREAPTMNQ